MYWISTGTFSQDLRSKALETSDCFSLEPLDGKASELESTTRQYLRMRMEVFNTSNFNFQSFS